MKLTITEPCIIEYHGSITVHPIIEEPRATAEEVAAEVIGDAFYGKAPKVKKTPQNASNNRVRYKPSVCETCGDAYTPTSPRQRFCSKRCNNAFTGVRRTATGAATHDQPVVQELPAVQHTAIPSHFRPSE